MKKLLIAIVAIATLTSCQGLLDVIKNEPVFAAASSEVLDGQAFVLHRSGTCDYSWSGGNSDVTFKVTPNPTINGAGEEAVAYVKLQNTNKTNDVEFTIFSVNNDNVEHKSDEDITVKRWRIGIFTKEGDEIVRTFLPSTGKYYVNVSNNIEYIARPVYVSDDEIVDRIIIRSITKKNKPGDGRMVWDKNGDIEIKEAAALEFSFKTVKAGTAEIYAHVDNTLLGIDEKHVMTTVLNIN